MTVLTQTNLDARQADIETCLSKLATMRNQAESAAAELCGVDNAQAELMQEQAGDAQIARAAVSRMKARGYRISIPAGTGAPLAPNFGAK